jgi:hypothetical protein
MKKLLIIAFISLTGIFAQAQQFIKIDTINRGYYYLSINKPEKIIKNNPLRIILVYSSSIVLNGIGDGLNNNNHKTWGHACNAASIGVLLASPFIIHYDKHKWYVYLLDYGFLRFSLFDASYNIANNQRYDYIGTTAGTDIIFHKAPPNFRTFSKGISMIMGISLPINELRK